MKTNTLIKHVKRVARKNKLRPVLGCLHYNENGNIYATDTHRAIIIKDFHASNQLFQPFNCDVRVRD